ncbi:MAG: hypothetical protein WAL90_05410 [Desulfobacterales bacterium]
MNALNCDSPPNEETATRLAAELARLRADARFEALQPLLDFVEPLIGQR